MKVKTAEAIGGTTTEDILNENDGIVLPAGVLLSAALVNALLKQNIIEVDVEFDDQPKQMHENAQVESLTRHQIELREHINQLFLRHRGQFMKELQQCLLQSENLNS